MSRYIVRVIGPAGRETFLAYGREVERQDNATRYPHPSNAWNAAQAYLEEHDNVAVDVIDTRDVERTVEDEL